MATTRKAPVEPVEVVTEETSGPEGWIVEGSERANLPEKRDRIARDVLREINTFEDAALAYAETHGEAALLISKTELGDGFTHYKQSETDIKGQLVGVPLFIIEFDFGIDAESQSELVFIRALAQIDGETKKITFTDGSTGLYKELKELAEITGRKTGKSRRGGVHMPRGLRFSEYWYSEDERRAVSDAEVFELRQKGSKVSKARTYYLDTRAE